MSAADDLLETEAEFACLAELRRLAVEDDGPMERHCMRVLEVVSELARRRGIEVDRELVACAAILHDAGIYPEASTGDVYVSDGRRLAERILAPFSWDPERMRICGDAIERHHELRSQWDRGAEVELMRIADRVEVFDGLLTGGLDRGWYRDLTKRIPRAGFYRGIAKLAAGVVRDRPRTALRMFRPGG